MMIQREDPFLNIIDSERHIYGAQKILFVCGMKYQPVYKCPLCGRLLSRSQPQEVPTEMLPALLGKVIQHQQLAANPFTRNNVPMHIPCKCPDGSAGLAQFAGFRCVK